MDSIKRGLSFYQQVWLMVRKDLRLLSPLLYVCAVGLAGILGGSILIAGSLTVFHYSFLGWVVAGFFCICLLFILDASGELFSVLMIQRIYTHFTSAAEPVSKAWNALRRGWVDILSMAAAAPLVSVVQDALKIWKKPGPMHTWLAGLAGILASESYPLAATAMTMEQISFKEGLSKADQTVKDHLLPIRMGQVGVARVNLLADLVFGGTGVLLGLLTRLSLIPATAGSALEKFAATALGVWIACIFVLLAVLITSYMNSAYFTCLYLWARNNEGSQEPAAAPGPLSIALS